jgi:leader peptidase (prepilin peptidase) / N-methyltransferase
VTVTTASVDAVVVGRTPTWPALTFAAGVSLLFVGLGIDAGLLLAWAAPVVWAATIDARVSRLPDRVVLLGLAVFAAVLVVASAGTGSWGWVVAALAGAAVLAVPLLLVHLVSPAGLGFGDVKYGALIGAGVGVATGPAAVVLVFLLTAVVQLLVVWWRPLPAQRMAGSDRRSAPLGPAMAVAAGVWVLVSLISKGGV